MVPAEICLEGNEMIPHWPVQDPAESCKKVLKVCQSLERDTLKKKLHVKTTLPKSKRIHA
jgi:hypothetical protein